MFEVCATLPWVSRANHGRRGGKALLSIKNNPKTAHDPGTPKDVTVAFLESTFKDQINPKRQTAGQAAREARGCEGKKGAGQEARVQGVGILAASQRCCSYECTFINCRELGPTTV
jgi:hypothetical protein